MERAQLESFPILAELPDAELDALADAMTEVGVDAGVEIVTLDHYGTAVYFVEQGEADVRTDSGEDTQTVGPGPLVR